MLVHRALNVCVFQGEGGRVLEELFLPRVSDQAVGSAHGSRGSTTGGRKERRGEERSAAAEREHLRCSCTYCRKSRDTVKT